MLQKIIIKLQLLLGSYIHEVLYTTIAFIIFLFIYTSVVFFFKKQDWSTEKKRIHYVSARNLILLAFFVSIIFIWAGEIKTFLFSTAAIFGALMIVFKELLLSFVGGLLTKREFSVGDYISYEGMQGKIVDRNFFNTKVLISNSFKNQELVFPNMHYVTTKISNLSRYGKYQVYSLTFGVSKMNQVLSVSEKVLTIAHKALEPYSGSFAEYFSEKQKEKIFFEIPSVEPKLTYELNDTRKLTFTLHFMCHPLDYEKIEKEIMKDYLLYAQKNLFTSEEEEKNVN